MARIGACGGAQIASRLPRGKDYLRGIDPLPSHLQKLEKHRLCHHGGGIRCGGNLLAPSKVSKIALENLITGSPLICNIYYKRIEKSADGAARDTRMGIMSSSSVRSCGDRRQREDKSGRRGRTSTTRDGSFRLKGRGARRVRWRSWISLRNSSAGSEIQRRMRKWMRLWPKG